MFEKICNIISENSDVFTGAAFCFLISFLTSDKGGFMKRVTGGFLCSLFSTGLYYGIISVFPSVPSYSAVAIGSFVGFVGVDECKKIILDRIKYVISTKKGNDNE